MAPAHVKSVVSQFWGPKFRTVSNAAFDKSSGAQGGVERRFHTGSQAPNMDGLELWNEFWSSGIPSSGFPEQG